MKKTAILGGLGLLLTLFSTPVFPLSYQIDFNGEGGYDTSWDMSVSDRIRVAIWLDDYTCLPEDKLFGTQLYVAFDSDKLQSVEAYANDVRHGGPFDVGFSGFIERKPGIYSLNTGHFDYVTVMRSRILLGTITLQGTSSGTVQLRAANSLGLEGYDDGKIADCDLKDQFPENAVATITITGGSGDDNDDNRDRGTEEEEGSPYGEDSGATEASADGNEGASGRSGIGGADSDRAGPLSGRAMTTVPDLSEDRLSGEERNPVSQTGSGKRSSPQQQATGRADRKTAGETEAARSTTTVQAPLSAYRIIIAPSALTVNPGSVSRLSARTLFQGKEVEGAYDWKVFPASSIGSTIDKNGQFTAGSNASGVNVMETIQVTDTRNGTTAETVFTITAQPKAADACQLTISPSSAMLYPGDTVVFSGRSFGEKCREGAYKWRVNTRIGSEIAADGTYRAGKHSIGKETIDIIIMEDAANSMTEQALVTVLVPESVNAQEVESGQQDAKHDRAGKKVLTGGFVLVLVSVVAVAAGIVLFIKRKRR